MSADAEATLIPKEFLCRRCNHCSSHLRPDGLVDCQIAEIPVVPVQRSAYTHFEDCPQRSGHTPLPGYKLRLLASFARRVTKREGQELMPERIATAEAVIRSDMRTMARLGR